MKSESRMRNQNAGRKLGRENYRGRIKEWLFLTAKLVMWWLILADILIMNSLPGWPETSWPLRCDVEGAP
jgi:hypothetical protein